LRFWNGFQMLGCKRKKPQGPGEFPGLTGIRLKCPTKIRTAFSKLAHGTAGVRQSPGAATTQLRNRHQSSKTVGSRFIAVAGGTATLHLLKTRIGPTRLLGWPSFGHPGDQQKQTCLGYQYNGGKFLYPWGKDPIGTPQRCVMVGL
jgi:hypothetical protein